MSRKSLINRFVYYRCRNCGSTFKVFALSIGVADTGIAIVRKYGELPEFGPPAPPRLISLIGGERELFLKGRRAEHQGLGIAAFAYYRRVVESQKNRIIDELIRVSTLLGAPTEAIDALAQAKDERQFSTAVNTIKGGLPPILLIDGHNPLKLLHGALSDGLHAKGDEDCLELATAIRLVLSELSERLAQAIRDENELKQAVSKLLSVSR